MTNLKEKSKNFFPLTFEFQNLGPWGERKAAYRGNEIDLGKRSWRIKEDSCGILLQVHTWAKCPYGCGGVGGGEFKRKQKVNWHFTSRHESLRKKASCFTLSGSKEEANWNSIWFWGFESSGGLASLSPEDLRKVARRKSAMYCVQADGTGMDSQNFHMFWSYQRAVLTWRWPIYSSFRFSVAFCKRNRRIPFPKKGKAWILAESDLDRQV